MKRIISSLALIVMVFVSGGCGLSENKNHKVLIVSLSNSSGLANDKVYIEKALRNGGYIEIDTDTVRSIDPKWLDNYSTTNGEGSYLVRPMLLNWVSSRGWKLQTVFCVNLNVENQEFYFIK